VTTKIQSDGANNSALSFRDRLLNLEVRTMPVEQLSSYCCEAVPVVPDDVRSATQPYDENGTFLIVGKEDRTLENLRDHLQALRYHVVTVTNGKDVLNLVRRRPPQMLLLDTQLPDMSGIEILKRLRQNDQYRDTPVILLTARGAQHDRVEGLKAGADDCVVKPFDCAELLARIHSRMRIKQRQDALQEWNRTLTEKLAEQFEKMNRMSRFKQYLCPQVAEKVLRGEEESFLNSHLREITVVFLDLRGYTAFSDRVAPEEVMDVLRGYHKEMGKLILDFEGTLEHFAGDGMMVFFNDPIPCEDHTERAVRMALAMMAKAQQLRTTWPMNLDLGIGLAAGFAALGNIGFEGRMEYGAVGNVINLAARLCGKAKGGQILTDQGTLASIQNLVEAKPLKEVRLKGFSCPLTPLNILKLKAEWRTTVTQSRRRAPSFMPRALEALQA
jgi:adenylate cyclase